MLGPVPLVLDVVEVAGVVELLADAVGDGVDDMLLKLEGC